MHYEPEQFYLRSAEEMKARFAEMPEAVRNTLEVAEKCNVEIEFNKLHYPVFPSAGQYQPRRLPAPMAGRGLATRYTIHARAEGEEFVVDDRDPASSDIPAPAPRSCPETGPRRRSAGGSPRSDPPARNPNRRRASNPSWTVWKPN